MTTQIFGTDAPASLKITMKRFLILVVNNRAIYLVF